MNCIWGACAAALAVTSASAVLITSRESTLREYRVNSLGAPPLADGYDQSASFSGVGNSNLSLPHSGFRSNVTESLIYASGSGYRQLHAFQAPDVRPESGSMSQLEVRFSVAGAGANVQVRLNGSMNPASAHSSPEQENMFLALYNATTNDLLFDSFALATVSGGLNPTASFNPNNAWSSILAAGDYRVVIGFSGTKTGATGDAFYGQGKGDVTMSLADVVPAPGVAAILAFALLAQPRRREA
ncbi:MAG: hypothetical protein J0L78_02730 [Planctomycetes bacterium]|nr:hypothetical protein [Planctomycetota bacterium]